MPKFSLQLKPVGSSCNLRCFYCYAAPFRSGKFELMSDLVLERSISQCLGQNFNPTITWHGGEPTLAGVDFFAKAQALIDRNKTPGQKIFQVLQTNAVGISLELAGFFARNEFEIGVSLDGPQRVNDLHRVDFHGGGSFLKIMDGFLTQLFPSDIFILCIYP